MGILPFILGFLLFLIAELIITSPNNGSRDPKDKGTYGIVMTAWISCIVITWILFVVFPKQDNLALVNWIAVGFTCFASVLRVWSKHVIGKFYTMYVNILPDHKLITSGPYRYIRHPLYSAFGLFFLSWPLTLPNAWAILLAVLLGGLPVIISLLIRTRVEEEALKDAFSEEWSVYVRRTKRLIPLVY